MLVYPAWVLAEMRVICARHNVVFIADEVMTAWGRTGTLLACEQAGIVPDILCLSKGLTGGAIPLAVTMATPAIYDAHYSQDRSQLFYHSSSYTANPMACAAANANLDIWREEPVLEQIMTLTTWQSAALAKICSLPGVADARQLGTITAIDLEVPQNGYLSPIGPQLLAFLTEQNLLLRPLGNTIYVMPPYSIDQIDIAAIYCAINTWLERGH